MLIYKNFDVHYNFKVMKCQHFINPCSKDIYTTLKISENIIYNKGLKRLFSMLLSLSVFYPPVFTILSECRSTVLYSLPALLI